MAKNVFQPVEIVDLTAQKVEVQAPVFDTGEPEPLDIYEGPTADDLRREAQLFTRQWEEDKQKLIAQARDEAAAIREEAERKAGEEVKIRTEAAIRDKQAAEEEAEQIRAQAESQAQMIISQAEAEREKMIADGRVQGLAEGREQGWQDGSAEAGRLVGRLHKILDAAIARRTEMIGETEQQIIDLVLLISRKVVKVISHNQKDIVVKNIAEALRKLKSRADVSVRVNLADLEMASGHVDDFIAMVEGVKSITVLEDSSVDPGGAVVETDFGQIDARISSQLREIEDKITELMPSGGGSYGP